MGIYDIGSDHNTMYMKFSVSMPTGELAERPKMACFLRWNLNKMDDWVGFEEEISYRLLGCNCENFKNVNEAWDSWKTIVTDVGERVVGKSTFNGTPSRFWDPEIGSLIKSRTLANKFLRHWSKKGHCNHDLMQEIWAEYLSRKQVIQKKLRIKQ